MTYERLRLGEWGEDLAARWYLAEGYRVLERNWRFHTAELRGEVDLIVARRRHLVICEVKTRSSARFGTGAEAVDHRKQRQLRSLCRRWIAETGARPRTIRFDVATVVAGQLDIIENAF